MTGLVTRRGVPERAPPTDPDDGFVPVCEVETQARSAMKQWVLFRCGVEARGRWARRSLQLLSGMRHLDQLRDNGSRVLRKCSMPRWSHKMQVCILDLVLFDDQGSKNSIPAGIRGSG